MKARTRHWRHTGILALALAGAAPSYACQTDTAPSQGAACTYGETIPCGDGGHCTQTCLPDLSAYGSCICGDGGVDAGDAGKKDAR